MLNPSQPPMPQKPVKRKLPALNQQLLLMQRTLAKMNQTMPKKRKLTDLLFPRLFIFTFLTYN